MPDVLGRLAEAETGEPVTVLDCETGNSLGVGFGVLPQRPPDRLADEELLLLETGLTKREEPIDVRPLLGSDLADDGATTQPQVGIVDPAVDLRPGLRRMMDD